MTKDNEQIHNDNHKLLQKVEDLKSTKKILNYDFELNESKTDSFFHVKMPVMTFLERDRNHLIIPIHQSKIPDGAELAKNLGKYKWSEIRDNLVMQRNNHEPDLEKNIIDKNKQIDNSHPDYAVMTDEWLTAIDIDKMTLSDSEINDLSRIYFEGQSVYFQRTSQGKKLHLFISMNETISSTVGEFSFELNGRRIVADIRSDTAVCMLKSQLKNKYGPMEMILPLKKSKNGRFSKEKLEARLLSKFIKSERNGVLRREGSTVRSIREIINSTTANDIDVLPMLSHSHGKIEAEAHVLASEKKHENKSKDNAKEIDKTDDSIESMKKFVEKVSYDEKDPRFKDVRKAVNGIVKDLSYLKNPNISDIDLSASGEDPYQVSTKEEWKPHFKSSGKDDTTIRIRNDIMYPLTYLVRLSLLDHFSDEYSKGIRNDVVYSMLKLAVYDGAFRPEFKDYGKKIVEQITYLNFKSKHPLSSEEMSKTAKKVQNSYREGKRAGVSGEEYDRIELITGLEWKDRKYKQRNNDPVVKHNFQRFLKDCTKSRGTFYKNLIFDAEVNSQFIVLRDSKMNLVKRYVPKTAWQLKHKHADQNFKDVIDMLSDASDISYIRSEKYQSEINQCNEKYRKMIEEENEHSGEYRIYGMTDYDFRSERYNVLQTIERKKSIDKRKIRTKYNTDYRFGDEEVKNNLHVKEDDLCVSEYSIYHLTSRWGAKLEEMTELFNVYRCRGMNQSRAVQPNTVRTNLTKAIGIFNKVFSRGSFDDDFKDQVFSVHSILVFKEILQNKIKNGNYRKDDIILNHYYSLLKTLIKSHRKANKRRCIDDGWDEEINLLDTSDENGSVKKGIFTPEEMKILRFTDTKELVKASGFHLYKDFTKHLFDPDKQNKRYHLRYHKMTIIDFINKISSEDIYGLRRERDAMREIYLRNQSKIKYSDHMDEAQDVLNQDAFDKSNQSLTEIRGLMEAYETVNWELDLPQQIFSPPDEVMEVELI